MSLDGVRMGSAAVGPAGARTLRVDVTGLPDGGAVQVVRGAVDYAGAAEPHPNTAVVHTFGASDLARSADLTAAAEGDCFHRLQVIDRQGRVVAFGQPVWSLRTPPPTGVPPGRLVRV